MKFTGLGGMSAFATRMFRGRGAVAIADQFMVGGSNLLTSVVLVRGLGLEEFGKFSIAMVLLYYANSLQMSFVASPMLSIAPLMDGKEKRQFVEGMLAVQSIASLSLFVVFALAGYIAHFFTSFYPLRSAVAFACCVGTYQLQDWLRRYYFLYRKMSLAIINDFISYVVQLAALFVLWRMGQLTLFRAFLVMCITSVVAAAMGPTTDSLWPAIKQMRGAWSHCKSLSRDLLISNQVRWFGSQGILLIGTGIVGPAGIGGLRATQSLAGPVNLVLNSLENFLPIRVAEELRENGAAGAYKLIRTWLVSALLFFGLLVTPIAIFGKPILRVLFGNEMVAFYVPMLLQLVSVMTLVAERLWTQLYRGLQETRALLWANAICAAFNIGTVYPFGHYWHASGIVLSTVCGQGAILVFSMLYWMRNRNELVRRYPSGHAIKEAMIGLKAGFGTRPLSSSDNEANV